MTDRITLTAENKTPADKMPPIGCKAPSGEKPARRRRLSHEILGRLGISLAISLFLFEFLTLTAGTIAASYCDRNDLFLTYAQQSDLNMWILTASFVTAVLFFIIFFLFLLGQKIAYIGQLTAGVEALRAHRMDFIMPLEGNNELTELAETINYLSATEKQMREKERALQQEKEQLIRTLSHDIRTPLTSIMSYSELLLSQDDAASSERAKSRQHLELILQKAGQIKDLTDVLLDGGKRDPEYFEDARLLMEQLAAEAEETLENAETTSGQSFEVSMSLTDCAPFSGTFDVQELRRIFDNLTSNILKYADPARPVQFRISTEASGLVIRQENGKRPDLSPAESHRIGLSSIRRIAHNYSGSVEVQQDETRFVITITLPEL